VSRFAVRSPPIFPARDRQLSENPAASRFLTRFAKGSRNAASLPPSSSSSSCGELRAQEFHGNPLNAISNCVYARHSPRTCRRSTFQRVTSARGSPLPPPRRNRIKSAVFLPSHRRRRRCRPPTLSSLAARRGSPGNQGRAMHSRPPLLHPRAFSRSGISTCTTRGSGCRERTSLDVITPN